MAHRGVVKNSEDWRGEFSESFRPVASLGGMMGYSFGYSEGKDLIKVGVALPWW